MTQTPEFEPQIVAFCCLHCAYAAADLAGGSRCGYPPSIKIIAVPCTGRVDSLHLVKALEDGADGVMVAGCLPGRCHFQTGNLYANQRVEHVRSLLKEIGLEADRVRMINVSAGMGVQFAERAKEMAETITALGPNPLRVRKAQVAPTDAAMEETN
ncbi:MAG: hydrogenase iron-sulfur subunit [Deltaproteobacteria bacterium]|nr:hydrogenase iron-sulfur subunit [Deltaproteobacteria bacterium]MBW2692644.1 hydrogenase iron-sulfur subunit [Deltaproteobacteria bacterium]